MHNGHQSVDDPNMQLSLPQYTMQSFLEHEAQIQAWEKRALDMIRLQREWNLLSLEMARLDTLAQTEVVQCVHVQTRGVRGIHVEQRTT
jgi:hypothetical protein